LFVAATALLNLLCLALLPVALGFILVYSYAKRFTWLCHYLLGFTCSMATMGGFLAISGHFELRYFVLMGAVALWVAGFDILYACQDVNFDRSARLFSIPARFGARAARRVAFLSHLGALAGFALLPLFWPLGWIYAAGWLVVAGLLAAEQILARGPSERHIRLASYGLNQIVAVCFALALAADVWLGLILGPPAAQPLALRVLGADLVAGDLFAPAFWQGLAGLLGHLSSQGGFF
jgi:4-hydroxybenzoate polyprenyltransferase